MAWRYGKTAFQMGALLLLVQMWNNLRRPEEEKDLPEDVRNRPHLTLGRDKDGNVIYEDRLGALSDLLEWFNLDQAPRYANEIMKNRMTLKDAAIKIGTAAPNKIFQGIAPFYKSIFEAIGRQSYFPTFMKPKAIHDVPQHIARSLGIVEVYNLLTQKPSRGYKDAVSRLFVYKSDPGESAYWDIVNEVRGFKKSRGETSTGFWMTPRGNALYYLKQAFRYNDKDAVDHYLKEYMSLGGSNKGLRESFSSMNPLAGFNPQEREDFIKYIGPEKRELLDRAMAFYKESLAQIYQQIPSLRQGSAGPKPTRPKPSGTLPKPLRPTGPGF